MKRKTKITSFVVLIVFVMMDLALAKAGTKASTIGNMASNLVANFTAVGKLMVGMAYMAGVGFGIASIFKFKQHKDNPTQVTIGTPFALLTISVLLVFLPGLYGPAGSSIFGTTTGGQKGSFSGSLGDLGTGDKAG
jgi:intracellular multiplication protein IcmD